MNKIISLVILAVGITLLVFGVLSANSTGAGLSHFFTTSPTNKTLWLLIGGVVAALVGLSGLVRRAKAS